MIPWITTKDENPEAGRKRRETKVSIFIYR
jgi:hypothetical protein